MSNTALICCGYSTAAWLKFGEEIEEYTKISVTSYTASLNRKIMQSKAALGYAASVTSDWRRSKGPFLEDVPGIDLSISFEVNRKIFRALMSIIGCWKDEKTEKFASKRDTKLSLKITDHASALVMEFTECYISKLSFSISKDSILSVSMDLFTCQKSVGYSWADRTNPSFGPDVILPVESQKYMVDEDRKEEERRAYHSREVIPYYDWAFRKNGIDVFDIVNFSLSFSQEIEPKFTCPGIKSQSAPAPSHFLFGLPTISLSIDYVIAKSGSISFGSSSSEEGPALTYDSITENMNAEKVEDFSIRIRKPGLPNIGWEGGEDVLRITGVHSMSIAPERDSFPIFHMEYLVNGLLEYIPTEEEKRSRTV